MGGPKENMEMGGESGIVENAGLEYQIQYIRKMVPIQHQREQLSKGSSEEYFKFQYDEEKK